GREATGRIADRTLLVGERYLEIHERHGRPPSGDLSHHLIAVFDARLAHHVLENAGNLVTEDVAQAVDRLEPLELLAPVAERRFTAQHAGVAERVDDRRVAGKGLPVAVEREARLEGERGAVATARGTHRRAVV